MNRTGGEETGGERGKEGVCNPFLIERELEGV